MQRGTSSLSIHSRQPDQLSVDNRQEQDDSSRFSPMRGEEDAEKKLHNISKKLKWEEARNKASKALKNAANPDGLVAVNIKRLLSVSTGKVHNLLTKAQAAEEELVQKRLHDQATEELRNILKGASGGLAHKLLNIEGKMTEKIDRDIRKSVVFGYSGVKDSGSDDDDDDDDDDDRRSRSRSTSIQVGEIGQGRSKDPRKDSGETIRTDRTAGGRLRPALREGGPRSPTPRVSAQSSKTRFQRESLVKRDSMGRRGSTKSIGTVRRRVKSHWYDRNPRVYICLRNQLGSKSSAVVVLPDSMDSDGIIMDGLLHLPCNIAPIKESVQNVFTISLIGFMPKFLTHHYILAEKRFHVFDIARSICAADNYKLKSIVGETVIAEIEVEMCFGYGMFGYGYSNQLQNAGKNVIDGLTRSIFIRPDPGPETEMSRNFLIKTHAALPVMLSHPRYVDFRNKLEIYPASAVSRRLKCPEHPIDAEVQQSTRRPRVALTPEDETRLRRSLQPYVSDWQTIFYSITDRRQRLVFLKGVVLNEPEVFETHLIKGLKPIDHEPSTLKENLSKFSEKNNVKIVHVENMSGLKVLK